MSMMTTHLVPTLPLFVSLLLLICAKTGWAKECPKPAYSLKSRGGGVPTSFSVKNNAGVPIVADWISSKGRTGRSYDIEINDVLKIDSFTFHSFRIRADNDDKTLLMEYTLKEKDPFITVEACDGLKAASFQGGQENHDEMQKLVHDQTAPCLPPDKSSEWSCIQWVSKEDYQASRVDNTERYGFNSTVEAQYRKVGETMDRGYTRHIPQIPRVTNGKGFLKMSFTDTLRETLMPWYDEVKKGGPRDSVEVHPPIPGGFTNSHAVTMSKIDLDKHRHIQRAVYKEMQRVLEWWTGQPLRHTSTFGLRIYHRDSMLINHVDRADTHIASAVIQVGQEVDEGWPLEVLDLETGNCAEVYLQPGEMVLYEGARFPHGRPMRFNGTDFANIFTHFRPQDWYGPGKSPEYDGKLDDQGYHSSLELKGGEDRMRHHTEL